MISHVPEIYALLRLRKQLGLWNVKMLTAQLQESQRLKFCSLWPFLICLEQKSTF